MGIMSTALCLWVVISVIIPLTASSFAGGVALGGSSLSGALSYLESRQVEDGGFAEPGRSTRGSDSTTAWCVMALCAAGRNPHEVRKGGLSPLDFLASQSGNWRSATDYQRTLLAAAAAGENLRDFGGVDLVERVKSFQRGDGRIGDAVNSNAFGIMAYVAAGIPVPPGAVSWHRSVQNPDGGWGVSPGMVSNPDMTAASIMALRAAGVSPSDESIRRAISYLRSAQNPDGGFSHAGGASDTASTAWCAQAIAAVGEDPGGTAWSKGGKTPLGFIASMQAPDGHFRWRAGSDQNPVWTTAYAICALARKPFPIKTSFKSPGRVSGLTGAVRQPDDIPSEAVEEGASDEKRTEGQVEGERSTEGEGEVVASAGEVESDVQAGEAEVEDGQRKKGARSWWVLFLALIIPACVGACWFLGKKFGWDFLSSGRSLLSLMARVSRWKS